jgi:RNA polymerase sigma-70 factor (ECF subfamily)
VRKAVSRLRRRFRDGLRQQIAATLENPDEARIDEELLALKQALREG